jgi:HptB-dependent secretion and biofilm anti anti-sigma factor
MSPDHWPKDASLQTRVEIADGRATIGLTGRFDFSAHRVFREACAAPLESSQVCTLDIDLAAVDYIDSSALGMLLMLREKAQAANKTVLLSNCKGAARQVLEIANFGKLFSMK